MQGSIGVLDHVEIMLPATFSGGRSRDRPLNPATGWEGRLALWSNIDPSLPEQRRGLGFLELSLSPAEGYAALAADPDSRQSGLRECRFPVAEHMLHIVAFRLEEPNSPALYYVAAYCDVSPGIWLQCDGAARHERGQHELVAALLTLRIGKPPDVDQ